MSTTNGGRASFQSIPQHGSGGVAQAQVEAITQRVLREIPKTTRSYALTGPPVAGLSWRVDHHLGTEDVVVSVRDAATKDAVDTDVNHTSPDTVTLGFTSSQAVDSLRVVVVG